MGVDKSSDKGRGARVWAEAGMTLAVTEDPPQFVRFSFGAEMESKASSKKALKAQEEKLFAFCEEVVLERVDELVTALQEKNAELLARASESEPYPYQE